MFDVKYVLYCEYSSVAVLVTSAMQSVKVGKILQTDIQIQLYRVWLSHHR